jgi:hypothetical protein
VSYQHTFYIKKTGNAEWTILAEKGHTLHTLLECRDKEDALKRAEAWASSWRSVIVKVMDEQQN